MHNEETVAQFETALQEPLAQFLQDMDSCTIQYAEAANTFTSALTTILRAAGEKCFGKHQVRTQRVQWWNKEYADLRHECWTLNETQRRTGSDTDKLAFQQRRGAKKQLKRDLKRAYTKQQANHVSKTCTPGRDSKVSWVAAERLLKLLTRGGSTAEHPVPSVLSGGVPTDNSDTVMQVFSNHYQSENYPVPHATFCAQTAAHVRDTLHTWRQNEPENNQEIDDDFTLHELQQAAATMHNWKAADHDDMICALLKAGGLQLQHVVLQLLTFCWTHEIPMHGHLAQLLASTKPGTQQTPPTTGVSHCFQYSDNFAAHYSDPASRTTLPSMSLKPRSARTEAV